MAATIRGKRVIWGIPEDIADAVKAELGTQPSGVVQSVDRTDNADETKYQDEQGDPISQVFSGQTAALTLQVLCDANTELPTPGDMFSGLIGNDSPFGWAEGVVVVQPGVQTKWANKEAKSLSVPVVYFPNMTEPA